VPLENGLPPQELAIWAVYPSARLVSPKLRKFVAALEEWLRGKARLAK
jgi:DNA-binding transcriptional LysR family regulator